MLTRILCAAIVALSSAVSVHAVAAEIQGPVPLMAIASLDVPRYMGTWYEIAKFPNRFQKQCMGYTRADYRIKPDDAEVRVQVINRCRTGDGETIEAVGTARQLGADDSPKLQVRFAPAWLSFLPWVWGNYWVIDLDPDYQFAAVSEPQREYLWVLARTPRVEAQAYEALLQRLQAKGFDVTRLETTRQ